MALPYEQLSEDLRRSERLSVKSFVVEKVSDGMYVPSKSRGHFHFKRAKIRISCILTKQYFYTAQH
jgi:hypothetical protein